MNVTIVAPAFNEEAVVESFVRAVTPVLGPDWELLVVDDGSSDATPEILARLVEAEPRLRVVTHERNRGMGAALVTGFEAAKGDVVVTMDADLSHPLELLGPLVAGTATADAVFGSRYIAGGGMIGVPFFRVAISQVANLVLRLVFWTRVRDLTTGLRAYRTDAVRGLDVQGTGFETQLELTVRLIAAGRSIAEIPLMLRQREAGESKMRYMKLIKRYGRMVATLMLVRWGRR